MLCDRRPTNGSCSQVLLADIKMLINVFSPRPETEFSQYSRDDWFR
jgi:hypothetical protein